MATEATRLRPADAPRSAEAGYNFVALIVAITILNVLLAISLPLWSKALQREKEEELIFRGLQYAEAIRVFKIRYGRSPVRLEELVEVKPRSIRRLWKDPMTKDGSWALIFETGQPGAAGAQGGQQGGPGPAIPSGQQPRRPPPGQVQIAPGTGPDANGRQVTVGPIAGVRSKSSDESIKVLFGAQQYNQWLFTAAAVTPGGQAPPGAAGQPPGRQPGAQGGRRPGRRPARRPAQAVNQALGNAPGAGVLTPLRWIGRPFRDGLQPQQGQLPGQPFANDGMPGGLEPGLQPPPAPGGPGRPDAGGAEPPDAKDPDG